MRRLDPRQDAAGVGTATLPPPDQLTPTASKTAQHANLDDLVNQTRAAYERLRVDTLKNAIEVGDLLLGLRRTSTNTARGFLIVIAVGFLIEWLEILATGRQ